MINSIKDYFFCDIDEDISTSDKGWMGLIAGTVVFGFLVGLVGLIG